jgi:16S rRNA (guanine966-N2)-methyltransferase
VIAGSAKGMRLRAPSSAGTRPITDRGKEALFSILMPRLQDGPFLDLFAGTGGVGIEALSRGAQAATFVELDPVALGDLQANLEKTKLADRADVVRGDAFRFLDGLPRPYAIVFIAPPQWKDLWTRTMRALDAHPDWVDPDGVAIVQTDPKELADLDLENFERLSVRRYSNVAFSFYGRP